VNVAYGSASSADVLALNEAARLLPASDACSVKAKDALKRFK
jgi:hypothetical protein